MATGGTGGGTNLGGAQFTITVNTTQFTQGLQGAQQAAQQTTTTIVGAFTGLAIVPRQLAAINQSIMATNTALASMSSQLQNIGSSGGGGGAGNYFKGLGYQMMVVAQIADDLQYGFQAIVNQMPQVGMAIGSVMGLSLQQSMMLGAGLGVLGVVINQVINHWGTLVNVMQSVTFGTPLSQLEALRVKAEEAGKAFDELTKKAPKGEMAAAAGFEALSAEKGHGKVLAGLTAAMMGEGVVATAGERAQLRYAAGIGNSNPAEAARVRAEVRDAQNTRTQKDASLLMGEATMTGEAGDRARARIEFLAGRNPGMFPAEFKQDMRLLTPEGKAEAEQKRLELQGGRNNRKAGDEARDRDRKLVDELNAQGKENQERTMRLQEQEKMWALQDRREALQDRRAAIAKEPKPFTGDFFEFATNKLQQAALEQQKLQRLEEIDKGIKQIDKTLKEKQREAARAG